MENVLVFERVLIYSNSIIMINNPVLLSAFTEHSFYISHTAPLPTSVPVRDTDAHRPDRNCWNLQMSSPQHRESGVHPRPCLHLPAPIYPTTPCLFVLWRSFLLARDHSYWPSLICTGPRTCPLPFILASGNASMRRQPSLVRFCPRSLVHGPALICIPLFWARFGRGTVCVTIPARTVVRARSHASSFTLAPPFVSLPPPPPPPLGVVARCSHRRPCLRRPAA